jgi:hypothetical protein
MNNPALGNMLIFLAIVLVLFLIGRELVCWYWKINRIVGLLESIELELKSRTR